MLALLQSKKGKITLQLLAAMLTGLVSANLTGDVGLSAGAASAVSTIVNLLLMGIHSVETPATPPAAK